MIKIITGGGRRSQTDPILPELKLLKCYNDTYLVAFGTPVFNECC